MINRRDWLKRIAGGVLAGGMRLRRGSAASLPFERPAPLENPAGGCPLALKDYQPKSMLHTVETPVSRARFPVTDVHTHLSFVAGHKNGVPLGERVSLRVESDDALRAMDRKNIRIMVDLTGGVSTRLESAVRKFHGAHPDRFLVFTEPWWERTDQPGYSQFQADQIERAHRAGRRRAQGPQGPRPLPARECHHGTAGEGG